jgi:large subunit ribosomal protein L17
MRKRLAQFRKLGRTPEHKWAMLRNMVTSLIKYERIETTLPKAKELRTLADKVVTYAKANTVHARQLAMRVLREKPVCERLFEVLGPRYADRDGGYTRVMKLSRPRKGDNAPMAVIEYVDRPGEIRAARVPAKRKERYFLNNLGEVLEHAGITPAVVDASSRMQEQEQEQQTR